MRSKEKKRARNSVRGDKLPYLMRNRCMCALWLLSWKEYSQTRISQAKLTSHTRGRGRAKKEHNKYNIWIPGNQNISCPIIFFIFFFLASLWESNTKQNRFIPGYFWEIKKGSWFWIRNVYIYSAAIPGYKWQNNLVFILILRLVTIVLWLKIVVLY